MAEFNPEEKNSWYFGMVTREEANTILHSERDSGIFLVRDSRSIQGDYVLCVREENGIKHYIINKIQTNGQIKYRIGDKEFFNLPAILHFYCIHYLESTPLIRPAKRLQFVAKHSLVGKDDEDLSFEKGETLTLLRKEEPEWWLMCNEDGKIGLVPVNYLDLCPTSAPESSNSCLRLQSPVSPPSATPASPPHVPDHQLPEIRTPRHLPAKARVIRRKVACPYDSMALTLEVGDVVTVTMMHPTGQWEGEVNGKRGTFPFTYVKFEDELEEEN